MKLIPTKEFTKTVSKITDKIALKRLDELTVKLEEATFLSEIPNVIQFFSLMQVNFHQGENLIILGEKIVSSRRKFNCIREKI